MRSSKFTFAFGLGGATNLRVLPSVNPGFTWLYSIADRKKHTPFHRFFNVPKAQIKDEFILDSGGYSRAMGSVSIDDVDPEKLAQITLENEPLVVIGPDDPQALTESFGRGVSVNRIRFETFFSALGNYRKSKILGVSHGRRWKKETDVDLASRYEWLDEMDSVAGSHYDGLALAASQNLADAPLLYLSLLPWARGYRYTHLLGVGTRDFSPALTYLSRVAGQRLSMDSKTYTIEATQYLKYFFYFRESHLLKGFPLAGKKVNLSLKLPDCSCTVCRLYGFRSGGNIADLRKRNAAGEMDAARLLYAWLPAHNVLQVQAYVDSLNAMPTGELRDLALCTHEAEVEMIDAVVAAGKDQYARSLKHLKVAQKRVENG